MMKKLRRETTEEKQQKRNNRRDRFFTITWITKIIKNKKKHASQPPQHNAQNDPSSNNSPIKPEYKLPACSIYLHLSFLLRTFGSHMYKRALCHLFPWTLVAYTHHSALQAAGSSCCWDSRENFTSSPDPAIYLSSGLKWFIIRI